MYEEVQMMKLLNEALIEDEETMKNLTQNLQSSIQATIELQNKYKTLFSNYIMQLVELNTENFDEKKVDTVIDLLYKLEKILPSMNELMVPFRSIKKNVATLSAPYDEETMYPILMEYANLQKQMVLTHSEWLDFLNSTTQFMVFQFPTSTEEEIQIEEQPSTKEEANIELAPKEEIKIEEQPVTEDTVNAEAAPVEVLEEELVENTLLISDIQKMVILPYTKQELDAILEKQSRYTTYKEVIEKKYTIPYSYYRVSSIARFKEAFKLMRNKEHASIKAAFDLGMELLFQYNLHPAIISACKNLDTLDIYLDYLETNETDKFDIFTITYEMLPMVSKHKK